MPPHRLGNTPSAGASRTVHTGDALVWLGEQPSFAGCSFISSLPDISELPGLTLDAGAAPKLRRTLDSLRGPI